MYMFWTEDDIQCLPLHVTSNLFHLNSFILVWHMYQYLIASLSYYIHAISKTEKFQKSPIPFLDNTYSYASLYSTSLVYDCDMLIIRDEWSVFFLDRVKPEPIFFGSGRAWATDFVSRAYASQKKFCSSLLRASKIPMKVEIC